MLACHAKLLIAKYCQLGLVFSVCSQFLILFFCILLELGVKMLVGIIFEWKKQDSVVFGHTFFEIPINRLC